MLCKKKTISKYTNRKSPAYSANDPGCQGKMLHGNDHMLYESVADKNDIYRWKLVKNASRGEDTYTDSFQRYVTNIKRQSSTKKKGVNKRVTNKKVTNKKRGHTKKKTEKKVTKKDMTRRS